MAKNRLFCRLDSISNQFVVMRQAKWKQQSAGVSVDTGANAVHYIPIDKITTISYEEEEANLIDQQPSHCVFSVGNNEYAAEMKEEDFYPILAEYVKAKTEKEEESGEKKSKYIS